MKLKLVHPSNSMGSININKIHINVIDFAFSSFLFCLISENLFFIQILSMFLITIFYDWNALLPLKFCNCYCLPCAVFFCYHCQNSCHGFESCTNSWVQHYTYSYHCKSFSSTLSLWTRKTELLKLFLRPLKRGKPTEMTQKKRNHWKITTEV